MLRLAGALTIFPGCGEAQEHRFLLGGSRNRSAVFPVRKCRKIVCAAPKQAGNAPKKKKQNLWSIDLDRSANANRSRSSSSSSPTSTKSKNTAAKKKPKPVVVSRGPHVSGIPIVDQMEVLQEEETVPSPVWNTFASNSHGVWKGVGAVFSPETAEVEPVGLGRKNEYLYDCRVVSFVDPGKKKNSVHRQTLWDLPEVTQEVLAEELGSENDEEFDHSGIDAQEAASDESGEEFDEDEEDVSEEDFEDDDGEDEEDFEDDDAEEVEEFSEEDEFEDDFEEAEIDDAEGDELGVKTYEDIEVEAYPLPQVTTKYSYEGMKGVMENVSMATEPGLVYFEDGTYSQGPAMLLRPKDDTSVARGYFYSPTYKIEQCLVKSGHKRVRFVHTISVKDETDEVEFLRVAVYEEEWLGPVHAEGMSESNKTELDLLSKRRRVHAKDLVGIWKVFEVNASVTEEQKTSDEGSVQAGVFMCKEFRRRRRLPRANIDEERGTVLWLPGEVYTSVELTASGVLRISAGWHLEEGMNLVIERDYDRDGKLLEVRSQTEIRESKSIR